MNRIFTLIFLLVASTASCQIPISGVFHKYELPKPSPIVFGKVFYQDSILYVLSYPQGRLYAFDQASERLSEYKPDSPGYDGITEIIPLGNHGWAIIAKGAFYYKDATGQEHFSPLAFSGSCLRGMVCDTSGELIVYDRDRSVYSLDRTTGQLVLKDSLPLCLSSNMVAVLCDRNNSKYFVLYSTLIKDTTPIPLPTASRIESPVIDSFNNFWYVSDGKVQKYNGMQVDSYTPVQMGFSGSTEFRLSINHLGYVDAIGQNGEIGQYDGTGWLVAKRNFDATGGSFTVNTDSVLGKWIIGDSIYYITDSTAQQYFSGLYMSGDISAITVQLSKIYLGFDEGYYRDSYWSSFSENYTLDGEAIGKVNCFSPSSSYPAFVSGTMLMGSDNGFYAMDFYQNRLLLHQNVSNSQLLDNTVTAVNFYTDSLTYPKKDTSTYVIGTKKGLSFKTSTGWRNYTTANSPLPSNNITVLEVTEGRVYIGTDNGVAVLYQDGHWSVYDSVSTGKRLNVSDIFIVGNALEFGNDDRVFFTTLGQGIFEIRSDTAFSYTTPGIPMCSDTVYFMDMAFMDMDDYSYAIVTGFEGCGILVEQQNLGSTDRWYYKSGFNSAYKITTQSCVTCDAYTMMLTDSGVYYNYRGYVGIPETADNKAQFKLYPNPANDLCTIELDEHANAEYTIADITGRQVLQGMTAQGKVSIDVSNLSPGVYLVQVNDNGKSLGVRRLLVD